MPLGASLAVNVDPSLERVVLSTSNGDRTASAELPVVGGRVILPAADAVGVRELRVADDDGGDELAGTLLGSTAINLFSSDESDVAPGDPERLVEMGRVPASEERQAQTARAEWWWPLALAALGLLAVEWLIFHRPTRRSLRRAFGRRPQPLGGRAP